MNVSDFLNVIGKKQSGLSLLKRKSGFVVIFLSACNSEIVKTGIACNYGEKSLRMPLLKAV